MILASGLVFSLLLPHFAVVPAASAHPHAPVQVGDGDAGRSMREAADHIAGMSPAERDEAEAALGFLTANCPYTRAAMLLPSVLLDALDEVPAVALDRAGKTELAALREGLALHVATIEALGVRVGSPGPNDQLYGQTTAALPDLARLRRAPNAVADMAHSVALITRIAETIDAQEGARLDAWSARVEALTGVARPCPRGPWSVSPGQPWTLGMELNGWRDELARLATRAVDPAAEAQIDALVSLLDAFGEASFASKAPPGLPTSVGGD